MWGMVRLADPADTIKARLQVQGAIPHQGSVLPYRSTLHAMQQVRMPSDAHRT